LWFIIRQQSLDYVSTKNSWSRFVHHGVLCGEGALVIRLGDRAFASSGDFGPAFMTAVDLKTGEVLWQDRTFARAQLLHADDKLIILDEDGRLWLAAPSPRGLNVLARAPILENLSWTPPTLVGTTLYARDRRNIVAVDLRPVAIVVAAASEVPGDGCRARSAQSWEL
jgi:hypothetical protein